MINRKKIIIWVRAARPQTLAAAFAPVMVGGTLAASQGQLNWTVTGVALLCAFLIQIGTNFANDYFDFINGADTDERIGFERATATGKVTHQQMRLAMIISLVLAFLAGLYLVWHAGWIVLLIGILCLVCGILYTGGPFPLGYNGLGDLFVFLFFGIIAVTTTYYVNALEWSAASFWASLSVGALATNILVVNNLRDVEQDGPAGKNTLGVIFGEDILRWEYGIMLFIAFAIPPHFLFRYNYNLFILLPYCTLPLGGLLLYQTWYAPKSKLNTTLERTAQFMTLYSILFSIGIYMG